MTLTSKDNCSNKLSGRKEVSWGLSICTTDISNKSKTSRQPTSNYTKKADRFLCTADRQTFEVHGFRPLKRQRTLTPFLAVMSHLLETLGIFVDLMPPG